MAKKLKLYPSMKHVLDFRSNEHFSVDVARLLKDTVMAAITDVIDADDKSDIDMLYTFSKHSPSRGFFSSEHSKAILKEELECIKRHIRKRTGLKRVYTRDIDIKAVFSLRYRFPVHVPPVFGYVSKTSGGIQPIYFYSSRLIIVEHQSALYNGMHYEFPKDYDSNRDFSAIENHYIFLKDGSDDVAVLKQHEELMESTHEKRKKMVEEEKGVYDESCPECIDLELFSALGERIDSRISVMEYEQFKNSDGVLN